jgi:hypothetical protein
MGLEGCPLPPFQPTPGFADVESIVEGLIWGIRHLVFIPQRYGPNQGAPDRVAPLAS